MSIQSVREGQDKLATAIGQDPAKAHSKNAPAVATLQQDLKFRVTGPSGETIETDMPHGMGGGAEAPNPGWLMRAALASCTATVIAMRAAKRGIELRALEVTVESESDHRGILGLDDKISAGLSGMRMRVKIGAEGAAPGTLRELVQWGDRHSPVGCTLREAPDVRLEVEVV
jgi:uncharacterized OsmC-like protein